MRLMGRGVAFAAQPDAERAPLMAWMEERRREKDGRHLSQLIVEPYGWSHLAARRVASRLYVEFAACPKPPVEDITRRLVFNFEDSLLVGPLFSYYLGNQEGFRTKNVYIWEQLCWQALYSGSPLSACISRTSLYHGIQIYIHCTCTPVVKPLANGVHFIDSVHVVNDTINLHPKSV